MFEILGISKWHIYGICMIIFGIYGLLISTNRFIKTTDVTGVTVIKDKQTGKEYISCKNGNLTELK